MMFFLSRELRTVKIGVAQYKYIRFLKNTSCVESTGTCGGIKILN